MLNTIGKVSILYRKLKLLVLNAHYRDIQPLLSFTTTTTTILLELLLQLIREISINQTIHSINLFEGHYD